MKKIVVFHPSNELYGADRILVNALAAFPEEDIKIVYLPKDGPLSAFLSSEVKNVEIKLLPSLPIIYRAIFTPVGIFKFVRNWFNFRAFIATEHAKIHFDLAYINTLSCSFILPIVKRLKIRSFCHVHEIIDRPKIIASVTARLTIKYADQTICVSEAVRKNIALHCKEVSDKLMVVHNGISPIAVEDKVSNEFRFYLFGRIIPKKGQWYLLDALKEISPDLLTNARFILVGGTLQGQEHLLAELQTKIEQLKLTPFIELQGFTSQISEAMEKADVCLVPSLMKDPFPTTVLEAMSAGKPVIATNHGGAKEVIQDGVNGYLISPDKPREFAQAIERFLTEKTRSITFGSAAKHHFNTGFTLAHFKKNWLAAVQG